MQIPKTLIHTIFQPMRAMSYVNQEWDKKLEDRFDDYISPILLWLFVVVIPPIIFGFGVIPLIELLKTFIVIDDLKSLDLIVVQILFSLIPPLVYIAVLEAVNKKPIQRSTLKRIVYLQCYVITPATFILSLFSIPQIIVTSLFNNIGFLKVLAYLFQLPGLAVYLFMKPFFFELN